MLEVLVFAGWLLVCGGVDLGFVNNRIFALEMSVGLFKYVSKTEGRTKRKI